MWCLFRITRRLIKVASFAPILPHLKCLHEVCNVFSDGAGALHCSGVVSLSLRQPVRNHHVDIYEV